VAAAHPDLDLVMAGPDEEGCGPNWRRRRSAWGSEARVHWTGMLEGDSKWGAFHAAEAFVLPSHQENFGVAVVEALACGLPVLISDKVNIWPDIAPMPKGPALLNPDTADEGERTAERSVLMAFAGDAAGRTRPGYGGSNGPVACFGLVTR
jgi:hypothetical protein